MTEKTSSDWITKIEDLLELTNEAQEFVQRASETFPRAVATHVVAVARLWQQANSLDEQIYALLNEMNLRLLKGQGQIAMTRGASTRPLMVGVVDEDLLFYECTWTLSWDGEIHGVMMQLSLEPQMESYHVQVKSFTPTRPQDIRYPIEGDHLKEALAKAYLTEVSY